MIPIDLTLLGAVELGYFSRNHFFLAEITNFGPIFGLGGFFFSTYGLMNGTVHLLVRLMTGFGG